MRLLRNRRNSKTTKIPETLANTAFAPVAPTRKTFLKIEHSFACKHFLKHAIIRPEAGENPPESKGVAEMAKLTITFETEEEIEMFFTTWGSVRGDCGHAHRTIEAAEACRSRDSRGCRSQGGYSDREIRALESPAEVREYDVRRGPGITEGEYRLQQEYGAERMAQAIADSNYIG